MTGSETQNSTGGRGWVGETDHLLTGSGTGETRLATRTRDWTTCVAFIPASHKMLALAHTE